MEKGLCVRLNRKQLYSREGWEKTSSLLSTKRPSGPSLHLPRFRSSDIQSIIYRSSMYLSIYVSFSPISLLDMDCKAYTIFINCMRLYRLAGYIDLKW